MNTLLWYMIKGAFMLTICLLGVALFTNAFLGIIWLVLNHTAVGLACVFLLVSLAIGASIDE